MAMRITALPPNMALTALTALPIAAPPPIGAAYNGTAAANGVSGCTTSKNNSAKRSHRLIAMPITALTALPIAAPPHGVAYHGTTA